MINSIVGGPGTVAGASGGKIFVFNNISTAPLIVAPGNTSRRKLIFHNPGTINVYVAPLAQADFNTGALSALTPSLVALGGCFLVYADGGTLIIEGECQRIWQAFSASGSGQPLTVMDSNI